MLNNSLKLGINSEKVVELGEDSVDRMGRKEDRELGDMENFGVKMGRLTRVVEYLVGACEENRVKIGADDHRHEKNINDSFRRIDEKITSSLDSMTKNINLYFTETNKKLASLETDLSTHKRETGANIETINNNLNQRVSEVQLKAALNGLGEQIKSSILGDLSNDQMKRMATLNEYSTKLQNHMNES